MKVGTSKSVRDGYIVILHEYYDQVPSVQTCFDLSQHIPLEECLQMVATHCPTQL